METTSVESGGCVWEIPGSGRRWNMAFGIFWNRCGTLINGEMESVCERERWWNNYEVSWRRKV